MIWCTYGWDKAIRRILEAGRGNDEEAKVLELPRSLIRLSDNDAPGRAKNSYARQMPGSGKIRDGSPR